MPNTLTSGDWYNPYIYGNEMLYWLRKNLGMAGRVNRNLDKTRGEKGDYIKVRRPMKFTAEAMPISVATGVAPNYINVLIDQWWGKVISLTDKERSATQEDVIRDHLQPMAHAIADKMDQTLAALYKKIPWYQVNSSPCAATDITALQAIMFGNEVPDDENLHLMLSGTQRQQFLNLSDFGRFDGAGPAAADTQLRGSLGRKFNFEIFPSQNTPTHTGGTNSDTAGAVVGAHAVGATSLAIDGITASGTLTAGDTLVIAGNTQRYAVTTLATASGGAATLTISPPLVVALEGAEVVTTNHQSGVQGLAFHRDFAALAMGVLPDDLPGMEVFTAQDPVTGLSVRVRRWSEGKEAALYMGVDALWAAEVLNPNMAVRLVD